jgi:hypothetical protein
MSIDRRSFLRALAATPAVAALAPAEAAAPAALELLKFSPIPESVTGRLTSLYSTADALALQRQASLLASEKVRVFTSDFGGVTITGEPPISSDEDDNPYDERDDYSDYDYYEE